MKQRVLIFFLSLCFHRLAAQNDSLPFTPPVHPANANSFISDSIGQYIRQGMQDWHVPGLALVIVKDDSVVLMKGYGIRDLVTQAPVDSNTLFLIASNTKLFTASSLALLENEGKLSLNDPVTRYFPDYRLYDSLSTRLLSIRDLLSHRIGTKTFEGDFTFWNTSLSRKAIMKRMRLLKPAHAFRQDFGYCNSCFLAAGQLIPALTGKTWEDFVQTNLLDPLGMRRTRVLSTGLDMQTDVATPYTNTYSDSLMQVPYDNWDNLAPAASIASNVNDLSHWLLMQLDSGRYRGSQVLPWAAIQKTRDINTMVSSRKSPDLPTHFTGYGLGLFVGDYNGRQVYWHTGGAGGMVSNVCFVPEEKLGIAILTNNDNQEFFEALRYQILDSYLGVPYTNRSQDRLPAFQLDQNARLQEIREWQAGRKGNTPELPLSAYAGLYSNPLYGPIQIVQRENQLIIHFGIKPELSATLDYLDQGNWLMTYNETEYGVFSIRFNIQDGRVKSVTTKQNPFVEYDPYVFTKD